jgi:predicted dinucleotide-binding enzyme
MKIAFLGAGNVGAPLAAHLANAGHDVQLAQRGERSDTITRALARSPRLTARPLEEAVRDAEVTFLTVPFSANDDLLPPLADALAGKIRMVRANGYSPHLAWAALQRPRAQAGAPVQRTGGDPWFEM